MDKGIEEKLLIDFEALLDELDYRKIQKMMEAVGWTYYDTMGQVPTIPRIEKMLYSLFKSAIDDLYSSDNDKVAHVRSGGFDLLLNNSGFVEIIFSPVRVDSSYLIEE
jgi:hypothetical protein